MSADDLVLCLDCVAARPMRGYDECFACFARFLLTDPAERAAFEEACAISADEDERAALELLKKADEEAA